MTTRSHSLKRLASIGLVLMICAGLASCGGGGGGGSRPASGGGGDQMMIMPPSPNVPESQGQPDLGVGTPTVSDANPETGATFTLSATVSNTGDGASAATTLRYYWSTDATITTSDTEVGMESVAGLAASGSGSGSVDLTAPLSPDTYYYGACVDAVAGESDRTNNCSGSVRVTVRQPLPAARPDLVVESPSVSDNGPAPGAGFTLSLTVRNAGDGESPTTTLRFYQSADATITTSDTEVGMESVAGLAASGSGSGSVDLTAPLSPDTYYYGACVDAVTGESDRTNNCSGSVRVTVRQPLPAARPDLVVESPSVSDNGPAPGAGFTLSLTVRNAGDGESPTTTLRFYQSADATITTSDTEVGMESVAGLAASGSGSGSVDLTAPLSPDTYYYGACVDAVTGESDRTNNCSGSVRVTVRQPLPAARPDLVVESPSVSDNGPAPGAGFTLSLTVRNAGDGESPTTTLRFYQSADATITTSDTEVGMESVAGLAASGSGSGSVDLTAPLSPDTYYYGACVDAVTGESDTTNNCSSSIRVVVEERQLQEQGNPDLVVGLPSVSDSSPETGASFTLSAAVSNVGDGESPATTLHYYRSTDTTITTSDTAVGTDQVGTLSPSGASAESISLTAPSTARAYYYGACVDTVTGESDTTNNCSASVKVEVEAPKYPDLEVGAPRVSDSSPAPGAEFTLSAAVRNVGDGESPATTLHYYRSTDTTITTSDTAVGTDQVGTLSPSGASAESISLTAPSTARAYYYGACVDTVTGESDTTNNCSASVKVDVEAPKYPDLEVGAPRVSDSGPETGASFTLSAAVSNVGDGESPAATLHYYRSTDATITTSDTAVGTDQVGTLSPSGASAESISLTAPSTARAYYYGACVDTVTGESDTSNNCSSSVQVTVREPEPAEVEVTPREVTLAALGNTATLTARVLDAQGNEISGEAVSWSSVSPEVATVNAAGEVTAVVNGRATVTASASGVSGTATVIVWQRAESVDIDPGEVELTSVGETALLTLRAIDANGHEAPGGGDLTSWRWRSADPNVATVSPVPVITLEAEVQAVAAGTTTVTVTAVTEDGGSLSATAQVTVLQSVLQDQGNPDNETPQVNPEVTISAGTTPVTEGTDVTFTITASPAPTSALTVNVDVDVTYADHLTSGTPPSTVTINANATTATLTVATDDDDVIEINGQVIAEVQTGTGYTVGSSSSARVVVENNDHPTPVASVEIDPNSVEFTEVGAGKTLTARILDSEGNETRPTSWGWSSADEEVATVNNLIGTGVRGWVKAIGAGTTTITLSAGGGGGEASGTATVTVTVSGPRVEISPGSLTFEALGETQTVTVKVLDANGDEDEDATFSYIGTFSPCCDLNLKPGDPIKSWHIERVDDGLEITAEGTGSGQLTISSDGAESAILLVTVYQKPASLTLSPGSVDLTVGGTTTLSAAIADANGYDMGTVDVGDGGKVVYWETSDSAVATVDGVTKDEDRNTGGTATVTAVAAGTVTITGRHYSGDITGTATVTVTDSN